ncbi:hypothetical protein [Streptobacillus moniliformis]|uniref:hypothetical protein n=1 Tax=Streptobacillus moniliformis TaxID=34105 RepID=UPI0007E4C63C|nr:hypothetical protein [Streptobacillus moniliformis]
MINKGIIIGLMTISTTTLGAEYYVINESKVNLGHEGTFKKDISTGIKLGTVFGNNKKEVGVFTGGQVGYKDRAEGRAHFGVNLKMKVREDIELIINASYQYMDKEGLEWSVKELLKSRGEWDSKFEKDKGALKAYYHSQGFRFKDGENLFSGIVNYDNKNYKLHTGLIYTADYVTTGDGKNRFRFENFATISTSKGKHDIEGTINYKLKKDTYKHGGRLKLELNTLSRLDKIDIHNKGELYLGTIAPNKKNYSILLENGIKHKTNNLEINTTLNSGVVFKEIEKSTKADSLKILYKPELKVNVKYNKGSIDIESKNKLMGRVETKG